MFLETVEKLNSINKTLALSFGTWSATVIFGLSFFLLLYVFLLNKDKIPPEVFKKIDVRLTIFILVTVCWLPIFLESFVANWQQIFIQTDFINVSVDDKLQTRLCAVDKNQKFSGSLCSLEPFIKEVKSLVPRQAKVIVISDNYFNLFLNYSLLSFYQVTNSESANYWLIYLPMTGYQLDSNNELFKINGEDRKSLGYFQIVKILNKNMAILKRQ